MAVELVAMDIVQRMYVQGASLIIMSCYDRYYESRAESLDHFTHWT
jgi:hypothetical protein